MRKSGFGFALLGVGVAGYALLILVHSNLSPVLPPFPWPRLVTYGLAVLLLAAGAGLFVARSAPASAIVVGVFAAAWAVASTPPILQKPLVVGSWYGFSEAVTTLVGAWIFYAELRGRATAPTGERALRIAQALFGGACLVYGIAHFVYATYSEPFVPNWMPGRMASVYVTGVCHVAAGIGLIVGVLPRLAATLEAIMITLFGLLVWLPSYFAHPTPKWAGSSQNQWTEVFTNFLLAGTAWLVAESLRGRPWGLARRTKSR